jgi:PatG C-terminal
MAQSQAEVHEQTGPASALQDGPQAAVAPSFGVRAGGISPQACASCGTAKAGNDGTVTPTTWLYAIGNIEARFPSISVEKEFAQATGRQNTSGLTDRQVFQTVLSKPENLYLARQCCYIMMIGGIDSYILVPRVYTDVPLLVGTIRANPSPMDLNVVIGVKGAVAPPEKCNGLLLPIVTFDQIYSFDRQTLIQSIPKPENTSAKDFAPAAEEVFDRVMQIADNAGATDEHRALNYLAVRYPAIYVKAAEYFAKNSSLSSVDVQVSRLSGARNLMDVIFSYTNRTTDVVDKCVVRVDVTDEFPFLVTKLSPYYDR